MWDTKSTAERIKKWLREEGLNPTDRVNPNTNVTFDISVHENLISVGFHKTSRDSIIIGTNIIFSDDEQKMLKFLKSRNDILWDLQKFLVQLHLEPTFKWNKDSLEKISFQKTLYFDNLTKDRFYEVLGDCFHSINVIREGFLNLGRIP